MMTIFYYRCQATGAPMMMIFLLLSGDGRANDDDDFYYGQVRRGAASMAETWSGRSLPRAVPVLLPQILHRHHHHHFHQRCRCRHRYHHIMFTVIIFTTTLCSCSILKTTVKLGKFGISQAICEVGFSFFLMGK